MCTGIAIVALGCGPGAVPRAREVTTPPVDSVVASDANARSKVAAEPGTETASAELEALWGFDRQSDYATLVQAIGRIENAIRENPELSNALPARRLAVSYLAEADRVRFQIDFVLQQPEYVHKASGAKFLVEHLQARKPIDPDTKRRVIDRVVADLRAIPGRGRGQNDFVGNATMLLTLLDDSRALDIVLTDSSTMLRLQRRDGFDLESDPEVFERLADRLSAEETETWRRAHGKLYAMMAARRRAGEPLVSKNPVLDMRKYAKMAPVR